MMSSFASTAPMSFTPVTQTTCLHAVMLLAADLGNNTSTPSTFSTPLPNVLLRNGAGVRAIQRQHSGHGHGYGHAYGYGYGPGYGYGSVSVSLSSRPTMGSGSGSRSGSRSGNGNGNGSSNEDWPGSQYVSASDVIARGDDTCCICYERYTMDAAHCDIIQLPCRHVFHAECVRDWYRYGDVCPLCRSAVV